jgi:hypothetical protein
LRTPLSIRRADLEPPSAQAGHLGIEAVSSMNTDRPGWRRIWGWRFSIPTRRFPATSARAHSDAISGFFIREPGPAQQP